MRFRFLPLLFPALAFAAHCGSKDPGTDQPVEDSGGETADNEAGDTLDDGGTDGATDTAPDTGPSTITCTKAPSYATPIRVNHNPDSLRRVANAGMLEIEGGQLMVAMLEALDSTRYGVFARTVDPSTGKAADDERLDVDADGLTGGSGFQIFAISGGAVGVRFDNHVRVYSKGKWSPDLAASLAFAAADKLEYIAAPNGQVLVTRSKGDAPFGQAIVYRPDEGGAKGSWSPAQTLDLDGASGAPRIERHVLSDGRFMTLIWQGPGGPSVRIRSLSGSWQEPFPKGEIGAAGTTSAYRVLADGSIVLVALEPQGPDTYRATTSTWTAMDGWSTARLLSKVTADGAGVVPTTAWPFLFGISDSEIEFVSWVAACAGAAMDCQFKAVSRRYAKGTWGDPVDLMIGTDTTGPDGLGVVALNGAAPLLYRQPADRTSVELRARIGKDYFASQTITKGSPLFGSSISVTPNFYGGAVGLWSLAFRTDTSAMPSPAALGAAAGTISTSTGSTTWGVASAGGFEVRSTGISAAYADGSGGFTVATNSGTDGSTSSPIIAHFGPAGGSPDGTSVVAADESSAAFVAAPKTAPRPNHDRAALFLVEGTASDSTVTGKRLRAYAWNGVGSGVPRVIATDTRNPRKFSDSLLVFGCGGAILYAIDPIDGTHALELVVVKEATGM
jgi:hypothetical protein